ncbi:hypothetical protein MASR2M44_00170 [Bacteroidota bacterium]
MFSKCIITFRNEKMQAENIAFGTKSIKVVVYETTDFIEQGNLLSEILNNDKSI